jgi:hypothetical protein
MFAVEDSEKRLYFAFRYILHVHSIRRSVHHKTGNQQCSTSSTLRSPIFTRISGASFPTFLIMFSVLFLLFFYLIFNRSFNYMEPVRPTDNQFMWTLTLAKLEERCVTSLLFIFFILILTKFNRSVDYIYRKSGQPLISSCASWCPRFSFFS